MQVKTKEALPALKIYDVFHIFIPKGGDERHARFMTHSQGNWEEMKRIGGLIYTIDLALLEDLNFTFNFPNWQEWTVRDWLDYLGVFGYLPKEI